MSNDKKSDSLQPEELRSTQSPLSRTDGAASSVAVGTLLMKKPQGFLEERSLPAIEMTPGRLRMRSCTPQKQPPARMAFSSLPLIVMHSSCRLWANGPGTAGALHIG